MDARLYERVSTDEQATTGFSLGAQHERLAAFCVSQGWAIAGRYTDEGASAKDLKRPAFQRMMSEVQPNDVILVYKLDRLTRSVRDLDDLLRDFERRNIWFRSVTEQFDTTTATGRLFIRMIAEMAQWERETIAERASMGKHRRVSSGIWPGGRPPFGYITVDTENTKAGRILKRLEPDPMRAHIVPMIFDKYLSGLGVRKIALWLNEELRVTTALSKPFNAGLVSQILRNPAYTGDAVYGRTLPKVETERYASDFPALVSHQVFDKTQAVLSHRKTVAPRHATGSYPLSGIALCGSCGSKISGYMGSNQKTKTTGRKYRNYICANYMRGRTCNNNPVKSVSCEIIEANLLQEIEKLGLSQNFNEFFTACEEQVEDTSGSTIAEIERLRHELGTSMRAKSRWDAKYESEEIETDEHNEHVKPLRERIKAIRARLAELEALVPEKRDKEVMQVAFTSFAHSWLGLTHPERKMLLQYFVQVVPIVIRVYADRRVELQLRPAFERLVPTT